MDMTSFVLGLKKGEAGNLKTQEKEVTVTENGTIEVLPDAGYALSKVLMSVNVASGSEGGDGEWIIASGSAASSEGDPVTVEHGLGVMPDIVVVTAGVFGPMTDSTNAKLSLVCGTTLSEKMMSSTDGDVGYGMAFLFTPKTASGMVGTSSVGLENLSTTAYSCICSVTSDTMQIGTARVYLLPGVSYSWQAYARK